ncbi:tetratricopeptide repeat protein 5-like [Ornithodoros turicata]|uniref:tetratricopeptide repeat protein 5-like n=1 Tax=Ornithodoros turicata TaxID=34597 RepID=UPI003139FD03
MAMASAECASDSESKECVKDAEVLLESVKESVRELYDFRDSYYEKHPGATQEMKTNEIDCKLKCFLATLEQNRAQLEKVDKAVYLMLKGKALNIRQEYESETHAILSKAVKLNPKLVEAWNELGECYWKNNDLQKALNCYEGVLKSTKDKVALRNLSVVLRQISTTPEQQTKNICSSLAKAKEAVELDVSDGESWCVLAIAYITLYFTASLQPSHLQQSLAAFMRALEDPKMVYSPDLHYNYAMALRHQEDYQNALKNFHRSSVLDPYWTAPKEKSQYLLKYLTNVDEMIKSKGQTKQRKIQTMLANIKPRHLGPFKDHATIKALEFNKLKAERNSGCILVCKVLCNIVSEEKFPLTFCAVDATSTCFAVTVYNMAKGKGFIIGDTVVIPEPLVHFVQVTFQEKEISFPSVRVDSPLVLVVNGRVLSAETQSPLQLEVYRKKE